MEFFCCSQHKFPKNIILKNIYGENVGNVVSFDYDYCMKINQSISFVFLFHFVCFSSTFSADDVINSERDGSLRMSNGRSRTIWSRDLRWIQRFHNGTRGTLQTPIGISSVTINYHSWWCGSFRREIKFIIFSIKTFLWKIQIIFRSVFLALRTEKHKTRQLFVGFCLLDVKRRKQIGSCQ